MPQRMLRHKAMIQCARIAFGYGGIYDQDEGEKILENEKREAGKLDPRGEAFTDTSLRDQHYGALVDLMNQDKEEWQIADDLRDYVTETLNPFSRAIYRSPRSTGLRESHLEKQVPRVFEDTAAQRSRSVRQC